MAVAILTPSACPVADGNPVGIQPLYPSSDICCQSNSGGTEWGVKTLAPSVCPVPAVIPVGVQVLQPSPDICCTAGATSEVVVNGLVTYLPLQRGVSWADSWSFPTAEAALNDEGVVSSTNSENTQWSIARSVMQFDTSVLAGNTIVSVAMELSYNTNPGLGLQDVVCHIVDKGTIPDSYPFTVGDRAFVGTTSYGSIHVVDGQFPNSTWISIPLSNAVIAYLDLAGNTIFCAREAHDLNNVEPAAEPGTQALHRLFWNQLDSSTCCRLRVTVSTGATNLAVILTPSTCPVSGDNPSGMPNLSPSSQSGMVV